MTGADIVADTMWEPAAASWPVQRLDDFLLWAADAGASDVAFRTASPAWMEIDGRLVRASVAELDGPAMERLAEHVGGAAALGALAGGKGVDVSHAVRRGRGRIARFRCSLASVLVRGGSGIDIALRVLPEHVPTLETLGVEPGIAAAWEQPRGLTLVTGVPGSGKTTLLAAGTRHLLEHGAGRVQSYEAPIEFVFDAIQANGALMSSSEIPRHFASFADGLHSSLRRRPAAVIVGEARDRETVEAVVLAADFGISVFSTTHTIGVAATIRRMLAEFPVDERPERGAALIDVMNLVVTQCLVPAPAGGRTALREWLAFGPELKARLLDLPQERWAAAIAAEVAGAGQDLAGAADAAFEAGTIGRGDWRRLRAATRPADEVDDGP